MADKRSKTQEDKNTVTQRDQDGSVTVMKKGGAYDSGGSSQDKGNFAALASSLVGSTGKEGRAAVDKVMREAADEKRKKMLKRMYDKSDHKD